MPREKFKTLTEQMFYILLCLCEERCGIEILDSVRDLTDDRVKIGSGTLYDLLEQFTKEGMICQLGQARGMNKALEKMVQDMIGRTKDCEQRVLAIAHCNCPERAAAVKARIEKLANFKKIIIINTAGVSSMYANDGGVIMAV